MAEIYQSLVVFLEHGLTGHPSGKAAVRCGRALQMGIHQPRPIVPSVPLSGTRLLHFDGLTTFHFVLKLMRRACEKPLPGKPRHGPGRMAQIEMMRENLGDPAYIASLAHALKTLSLQQEAQLVALNALDRTGFVPNLGGFSIDLSVDTFDSALRRKNAGFLAEVGRAI